MILSFLTLFFNEPLILKINIEKIEKILVATLREFFATNSTSIKAKRRADQRVHQSRSHSGPDKCAYVPTPMDLTAHIGRRIVVDDVVFITCVQPLVGLTNLNTLWFTLL